MSKNIVDIANRLIPKPESVELVKSNYVTNDIIKQVLLQYDRHKNQLTDFAPRLSGPTITATCNNIWKFWHDNIFYQADDAGRWKQLVKSPAAVWADKFCDCKSFSVATAACLNALGIKFVFRFVSFNEATKIIPTHVYIVAYDENGDEIKIDCVLKEFNVEKPYVAKYDYLPQGLYNINGVPEVGRRGGLRKLVLGKKHKKAQQALQAKRAAKIPHKTRTELSLQDVQTEGEMELMIRKQALELEQEKAAEVHGIGSVQDNAYEIELAAINNAIYEIANPQLKRHYKPRRIVPATVQIDTPAQRDVIAGIAGKAKKTAKKAKKEQKKTAKAVKKNAAGKALNKKQAKRVEKTGAVVKKKKEGILKKIAKVVTAPLRLVAKGAIEVALPQSSPVFLYLFLDEKILAKAPLVVKGKRNKAQAVADSIINKVGMKRDHFMGIIRNGIRKRMGDTPENVIAQWIKDANFQIGLLPIFAAAGKGLLQLAQKLGNAKLEDIKADPPDPSDWISETQATRETLAAETAATSPEATIPIRTEDANYQQAQQPQGFEDDYSGGTTYNNPSLVKQPYNEQDFGSGSFGQKNYSGTELAPVVVKNTRTIPDEDTTGDNAGEQNESGNQQSETKEPQPTGSNNNTLLLLGGVALAAIALGSAGGTKKKRN